MTTAETVPQQRQAPKARVLIVAGGIALAERPPDINVVPAEAILLNVIARDEVASPAITTPEMPDAESAKPTTELPPAKKTDGSNPKLPQQIPAPTSATSETWPLVERAQAGDKDAFAQLYSRYFDVVFKFVHRRVDDYYRVEDLTAETFLRAFRRLPGVSWQGKDIGAWFITIARNLVFDHFKLRYNSMEVPTEGQMHTDHVNGREAIDPEEMAVSQLTNVVLLNAVKSLNPDQQECIILRFLNDFSVAETASLMGKTEGAVKALQLRATRNLNKILTGESLR